MENKYHWSREDTLFVARRNIVGYIWNSAVLEGIAVTFPETDTIFEGYGCAGVKIRDILAINNLKHAWYFVLDNLDCELSLALVQQIHKLLGEQLIRSPGELRVGEVQITGTSHRPALPNADECGSILAKLNSLPNATEKALLLFLYLSRGQLFWDGNKRIATLAANQVLLSAGAGVLSVPIEKQPEFKIRLVEFYETNQVTGIMQFMYDYCIDGIKFD